MERIPNGNVRRRKDTCAIDTKPIKCPARIALMRSVCRRWGSSTGICITFEAVWSNTASSPETVREIGVIDVSLYLLQFLAGKPLIKHLILFCCISTVNARDSWFNYILCITKVTGREGPFPCSDKCNTFKLPQNVVRKTHVDKFCEWKEHIEVVSNARNTERTYHLITNFLYQGLSNTTQYHDDQEETCYKSIK